MVRAIIRVPIIAKSIIQMPRVIGDIVNSMDEIKAEIRELRIRIVICGREIPL